MKVEHFKVEGLLCEVSEREILPRWQYLREQDIEEKSPDEIVTSADRAWFLYVVSGLSE